MKLCSTCRSALLAWFGTFWTLVLLIGGWEVGWLVPLALSSSEVSPMSMTSSFAASLAPEHTQNYTFATLLSMILRRQGWQSAVMCNDAVQIKVTVS